jgi:hypothetical protein
MRPPLPTPTALLLAPDAPLPMLIVTAVGCTSAAMAFTPLTWQRGSGSPCPKPTKGAAISGLAVTADGGQLFAVGFGMDLLQFDTRTGSVRACAAWPSDLGCPADPKGCVLDRATRSLMCVCINRMC